MTTSENGAVLAAVNAMAATPARVEALDWLRGLAALSIMLFHLGAFGYLGGPFDAGTLLGKLGIYGVSLFFVLSGLSMAIGYDRYLTGVGSAIRFMIRRIFRIWPLLWVAVAYVVVVDRFQSNVLGFPLIFANITTLFGFIKPYAYINMGAWSIGNEMVYYAITPIFIWAFHRRLLFGNILVFCTIAAGMIFAFYVLSPDIILEKQWRFYINPFNNMFLYFCGIAIYYNFKPMNWNPAFGSAIFFAICVTFAFYPVSGDQVNIVTGANRVILSMMTVAAVLLVYVMPPRLPAIVGRPLERLGAATYGVYLLHPIAISALTILFSSLGIVDRSWMPVLVITTTIAVAIASFTYFESPLVRVGKRLTKKRDERQSDAVSPMLHSQQEQL